MDELIERVIDAYSENGLREFLYELEALLSEEDFLDILEKFGFYYEQEKME